MCDLNDSDIPPDPEDESEWQNPTIFFTPTLERISISNPEAWLPGVLIAQHYSGPSDPRLRNIPFDSRPPAT